MAEYQTRYTPPNPTAIQKLDQWTDRSNFRLFVTYAGVGFLGSVCAPGVFIFGILVGGWPVWMFSFLAIGLIFWSLLIYFIVSTPAIYNDGPYSKVQAEWAKIVGTEVEHVARPLYENIYKHELANHDSEEYGGYASKNCRDCRDRAELIYKLVPKKVTVRNNFDIEDAKAFLTGQKELAS